MANSFNVERKKDRKEPDPDKEPNEDSGGDSDWESVSLDLEHWNQLVKQLEDVLLLNILLKSQPYGKAAIKDVNISIETLLGGGQGSVTDHIAVWSVSVGLEPKVLSSLFSAVDMDDIPEPQKFLDDKSDSRSLNIVKGLLKEVRRKFPYSLNHDAIIGSCGWEHLMQWSKNKDVVSHLDSALVCLNLLKSSTVKNGFTKMMWKMYILKTFEAAAHLMEKVGKTPKERLCRKDLEMTDGHLEVFLDFCCQILNIILETNIPTEVDDDKPNFPLEPFWQGHESSGHTALILMAINQKTCSNRQVYNHLMLATVMHLVVTFQMKNVKPITLFSTATRKAFFRELSYHFEEPTSDKKEETGSSALRTQFLLRATSSVVQGLPEMSPEEGCPSSVCPADFTAASKKFNCILDLGRGWELDLDEIRRHYVCELYSCGQDLLAQEVKHTVTDKPLLCSQLLLLAGQRVHKIIFDCPDPAGRLGCLTPDVSSFLKKLGDVSLRNNNVPLDLTKTLIDQILVFLPENSREHKLAVALKDSLQDLLKILNNNTS